MTDITPTILSLAGIQEPKSVPAGPMTGRSILPLLQDSVQRIYSETEPIGIEAAGHGALYKGNYKLVRNGRPYGDGEWRLYDISKDPGETLDLTHDQPSKFAELIRDYDAYTAKYGVLEMGINYEPLNEIQNKLLAQIGKAMRPWFIGLVIFLIGMALYRKFKAA